MKHTGQILHLPHMQVDKELRIFFSKEKHIDFSLLEGKNNELIPKIELFQLTV